MRERNNHAGIALTLFRKRKGILTKVLSLLPTGELHKDASECAMSEGSFVTLAISHVQSLAGVLTNIKKNECLAYGVCSAQPEGRILSSEKAKPGDITRTKDTFIYRPGCPALLMLDYDGPPDRPILSRDEWLAVLYEACPDLSKVARVWRPSTTSYIYNSPGKELRGLTGQRLYVAVADGADIPRAGEVLFQRLWLERLGHIEVSKAGSFMKRSPVDAAVFSPERLDFVAGAVCRGGLRQGDLTPLYIEGEPLLDTRAALPDLTPEEEAEYQRLAEAAKAEMRSQADKVRNSYIDERSDEIAGKRDIPKDEARRVVEAAVSERADLYPDFMLKFDKYGWISVADILKALPKYNGATLADPLEPDYNGGRNIARLYRNDGKPVIHSFAHGGKTYFLGERNEDVPTRVSEQIPVEAYASNEGHDIQHDNTYPYVVKHGAIHWIRETPDGPVEIPLCNFSAQIVEEVVRDDGAETACQFYIEGKLASGMSLGIAETTAVAFTSLNWATASWGSRVIVEAGQAIKDRLRCAIQKLSCDVVRRTVYGHIGWRKIVGEWLYLHAGGALGAEGNRADIEVDPGKNAMQHYQLPDPPKGGSLSHAVRTSLRLLSLTKDRRLGYLQLAAIYRAPTAECCGMDVSVFKAGASGAQKSETDALALAHFGAGFDSRSFPAGWDDTDTDLEVKAFHAKDAIMVIDDFKPKGSPHDISRLHAKADRIFRGAANKMGRGRRTSTLKERTTYFPRALLMASGEDIPKGKSLKVRLCILEMSCGDIDLAVLSDLQKAAREGVLAEAMAGYIRWLAPQIEDLKSSLLSEIQDIRDQAREQGFGDTHDRYPTNYAHLEAGLDLFLRFAVEVGGLSDEEAAVYRQEGIAALQEVVQGQTRLVDGDDEAARFMDLLSAVLVSGRAHVRDIETQQEPKDPTLWGWRSSKGWDGQAEVDVWKPQGEMIGWVDSDKFYLIPGAVYVTLQMLARDQNDTIPVTARTLWKRVADAGMLAERDKKRQRNTLRKRVESRDHDLICLFKASIGSSTEPLDGQTVQLDSRIFATVQQQDRMGTRFERPLDGLDGKSEGREPYSFSVHDDDAGEVEVIDL